MRCWRRCWSSSSPTGSSRWRRIWCSILLSRIDRSFAAAAAMVAALDRAGLARHRPITARLAGDVLRGDTR